jgi:hypothetical protein
VSRPEGRSFGIEVVVACSMSRNEDRVVATVVLSSLGNKKIPPLSQYHVLAIPLPTTPNTLYHDDTRCLCTLANMRTRSLSAHVLGTSNLQAHGSNTLRPSRTIMSLKRQNTSSPETEEHKRLEKRKRPSWVDEFETFKHPTAREQPRVDSSSGQQNAFPGLDDENDELIYGDPEDGLQYLRMVR